MNDIYKFVRGNPFDGLEDYKKTIRVKKKCTTFPIQLKMFEGISQSDQKISKEIHNFYRHMGELIYGDCLLSSNNGDSIIYPDSVNGNLKKEIKTVSPGSQLLLKHSQTPRYILESFSSNKPKKIIYQVFRHSLSRPGKNYKDKSLDTLVKDLTQNTKFHISLPLSIISKLYFYRNGIIGETQNPNPGVRLTSKGLNYLLAEPEKFIDLLDFDSDRFKVKKLKYNRNTKINGNKIAPFPILLIDDLNYNKSGEDFIEILKEGGEKVDNFIDYCAYLDSKNGFIKNYKTNNLVMEEIKEKIKEKKVLFNEEMDKLGWPIEEEECVF